MATATMTRSAHGLGTIGDDWTMHAICTPWTHDFLSATSSHAARARHLCLKHCPVLAQCTAYTAELVDSRMTPIGLVQAGIVYADSVDARRGPHKTQPADPGCGNWCATTLREAP